MFNWTIAPLPPAPPTPEPDQPRPTYAPGPRRDRLRELMADCPACVPEDADEIPDEELDGWIKSHSPAG